MREGEGMTFDQWYDARYTEWWKNQREDLRKTWTRLEEAGVPNDLIVSTFDEISHAIEEEHS
jgi:hypothetical protein